MASDDLPSAIRSVIAIQGEPAVFQPIEALGVRVIPGDFGFECGDAGDEEFGGIVGEGGASGGS
jgi:hypothetical protein